MIDCVLVAKAKSGDSFALQKVIESVERLMHRLLKLNRISPGDYEDFLQELKVKAIEVTYAFNPKKCVRVVWEKALPKIKYLFFSDSVSIFARQKIASMFKAQNVMFRDDKRNMMVVDSSKNIYVNGKKVGFYIETNLFTYLYKSLGRHMRRLVDKSQKTNGITVRIGDFLECEKVLFDEMGRCGKLDTRLVDLREEINDEQKYVKFFDMFMSGHSFVEINRVTGVSRRKFCSIFGECV